MRRQRPKEKGAALLTVLVAMMILTIMLFEFQYSAMVERKLAYNDLNQTQAYYLAKAGARIGLLRVALYARVKNDKRLAGMLNNPQMGPIVEQIWQLPFPPFPPSQEAIQEMANADQGAAKTVLEQTKITEGQYSATILGESSKINLNSLILPDSQLNQRPNFSVPPTSIAMHTATMLLNLLNSFMRESDNPYEEFPDLRPEELVLDIMDWVNKGDARFQGGPKDLFYEQQNPPYKAKRNRFFSIEELRLVKGIDEHLFQKLRPHITVYSYDGKLNINNASDQLHKALYADFTDDDIKRIVERRTELGGNWGSEKAFVDFVTQTLNRNGFTTQYPNPKDYPFTVGTESFVVESLGQIQKSASSVQRTIKAAVAFSSKTGGQIVAAATAAECAKTPGQFWRILNPPNGGECRTNPQNANECTSVLGDWVQQGAQNVCRITQGALGPPIIIPSGGAGGKGAAANKASALKILSWMES